MYQVNADFRITAFRTLDEAIEASGFGALCMPGERDVMGVPCRVPRNIFQASETFVLCCEYFVAR